MSLGPYVGFHSVAGFSIANRNWSIGCMEGEILYYTQGDHLTQKEMVELMQREGVTSAPKLDKRCKRALFKLRKEQRDAKS